MNKPILGKDVVIQFYKNSTIGTYLCATDVEIGFQMETKETKTIGDGVWKRKRGQSKSYTINVSGVVTLSEIFSTSFDLLAYYDNMVDIQYRMIFTDSDFDKKVIEGYALVTSVDLAGGSEGHATGSFTLEGTGAPDIRDEVFPCSAAIHLMTYLGQTKVNEAKFSMNVIGDDAVTRFEYTVDGGGVMTVFTDGSNSVEIVIFADGTIGSTHELQIWPVCDNGYAGSTYTIEFTKAFP